MVKQGFHIGERDWYLMPFYNVGEDNLAEVYETLLASGCPDFKAQQACMNLSKRNSGYTFTNFNDHLSLMFVSKATSPEQLFDSIIHEVKHLVEHISSYYGLDPKEELSAYLQGEVGRNMFPAVALVICPKCHSHN